MKNEKTMKFVIVGLLFAIALTSFFFVSRHAADPKTYQHTIASLDQKEQNVLKLTTGATATSVLITLIPDDVATPLADKLADVAGYLLVVICAVYAEKYLLTITGFAAFKILIPAACILGIVSVFRRESGLRQLAGKMAVFAVILVMIIPVSIRTSELVEGVYRESIEETLNDAQQAQDQVGSEDAIMDKAKVIINNYVQAVAIFIVTSCVIPVFVLLFFCWVLRMLFGFNFMMKPSSFQIKRKTAEEFC